jgi:hypothetical protein
MLAESFSDDMAPINQFILRAAVGFQIKCASSILARKSPAEKSIKQEKKFLRDCLKTFV